MKAWTDNLILENTVLFEHNQRFHDFHVKMNSC